jgi:hypothetical protein
MKNLYLLLILTPLKINSSWEWLPWPTVNNTITINPTISANATSDPKNTSSNNNAQTFDQKTLQDTLMNFKADLLNELKSELSSGITDALLQKLSKMIKGDPKQIPTSKSEQKFTKKNLFYAASTFLTISYLFTYIKIYKMNRQLNLKNTWSCWKYNLTIEQLLESQKEELKQELLNDAKRFYKDKIETFFIPNEALKTSILNEKASLNAYLILVERLKKYHLSFLFPIKEENNNIAKEKLSRLSLMLSLIN